jgi:hypothetical protein
MRPATSTAIVPASELLEVDAEVARKERRDGDGLGSLSFRDRVRSYSERLSAPPGGHEPHYPDGDEREYRSCESVLFARTFARLSRANPISVELR